MANNHKIGCIIISNSDDLHFLETTLREASHLFQDVVIATGTRLWNENDPENMEKVDDFDKNVVSKYDNVKIIKYNVPDDKMAVMMANVTPSMYWEGHARWKGLEALDQSCEYVMFLDSDEVIDGTLFQKWMDTNDYKKYDAIKLANYWYWREPIYRARDYIEDSVVLIKKKTLNQMFLFSNMGRHGVFEACRTDDDKPRSVMGVDGTPMIHHYSWVRNKDTMLRKVMNWGHRNDFNKWPEFVEQEFSRPFNGTDFIKNLTYDTVDDKFNLTQK
jgi:hypothetical protein